MQPDSTAMPTNRKLIDAFQNAVNLVQAQGFVNTYINTVQVLDDRFTSGFMVADAQQDEETKKALVKGLTDFLVEEANKKPSMAQFSLAIAGGVEQLCATLNDTVQDRSLIPDDFVKRMLQGASQMNNLDGGIVYRQMVIDAALKIVTAIAPFCPEMKPAQEEEKKPSSPTTSAPKLKVPWQK